jgi:hypothetical protein
MDKVRYTSRFKLDYRRGVKKGCDPRRLREAVALLQSGAVLPKLPRTGKANPVRFIARYVLRHMRRAAMKSALAVLLAALLFAPWVNSALCAALRKTGGRHSNHGEIHLLRYCIRCGD